MSTKKWKNNELMENLSEKFGFKMNLGQLKEAKGEEGDANPLDGERKKFDKKDSKEKSEEDKKDMKESRIMKIIKNEIRKQLKERK